MVKHNMTITILQNKITKYCKICIYVNMRQQSLKKKTSGDAEKALNKYYKNTSYFFS